MHTRMTLNGWRKIGVAAGALAVIAAGAGAVATQAFADPGATATVKASGKATGKVSTKSGKKPQCSDARADLKFTPVPQALKALEAAVRSVAQGTISDVSGDRVSATCHHPEMVSAVLTLTPADSSSEVQVSSSFLAPGEFDYAGGAEAYVSTCEMGDVAQSEDCQVSTLPDGTILRTLSFTQRSGGVDTTWQIAERLVDGYIVNAQAIGEDTLTRDQVADIASQLTVIK